MKFGQLMEYNQRNIFPQKSYVQEIRQRDSVELHKSFLEWPWSTS